MITNIFDGTGKMIEGTEISKMLTPLVEKYRNSCLWFLRENFIPVTPKEALTVLDSIEKHGDQEAFMEVRRIKLWLLQNFFFTKAVLKEHGLKFDRKDLFVRY